MSVTKADACKTNTLMVAMVARHRMELVHFWCWRTAVI